METPPTINCSADTNEVHPMLSLFSVSWNSENLFWAESNTYTKWS